MHPLLILSYGAPERQEDVRPFLHNLFAGKNVPHQRIESAVQKYDAFAALSGHYSPLNEECRKLIEGLRQLDPHRPIYWANLFWHPLLADTVNDMKRDGVEHAVCFATSAFDSPSGNTRYAEALAQVSMNHPPLLLEKLPLPFEHPLFIESQADKLREALTKMYAVGNTSEKNKRQLDVATRPYILFTAHSIPKADAIQSHYVEQLQSACRLVIKHVADGMSWELVYQSRSGVSDHWLGPDIKERISQLAEQNCRRLVVSPIGFFCENMETQYDLDIEAGRCCVESGIEYHRAFAVGAMPKCCRMILDLADSTN